MAKVGGFRIFTTNLLILLLVSRVVVAVEHTVGGSSGWTTGVAYDSWAAGSTFIVGDSLLFSYDSSHTVDVVDKDGYDNCDPTNATDTFQDGNTTITLTKSGPMFFICSVAGHCSFSGMKLSINVNSPTGGPSPPTTTTAPLPSPTSTTSTPPRATPPPSPSTPGGAPVDASAPSPLPNAVGGGFISRMSYVMLVLGSMAAYMCQSI